MRSRGFTLIELLVVISIVAVSFGIALDRLLRYQELGERAAVEQNIAAMNTALTIKFIAHITAGRPRAIAAEVGKNPVSFLARAPENYLGELDAPDANTLPRASWYFDSAKGELVYLPNRRRYLSSESGPPDALRFKVSFTDGGRPPDDPREVRQPFVAPVVPFSWSIG